MSESGYSIPRFVSARIRAYILGVLFALASVLLLGSCISTYYELGILDALMNEQTVSKAEIESNERRQRILAASKHLLNLIILVVFLTWFYRAHKNIMLKEGSWIITTRRAVQRKKGWRSRSNHARRGSSGSSRSSRTNHLLHAINHATSRSNLQVVDADHFFNG